MVEPQRKEREKRMWIKLCGMTRLEDARLAVEWGADAVGFVFADSPRRMQPEAAAKMIRHLPPVTTVGVFVNQPLAFVRDVRAFCPLDVVQLHGEETPDYCHKLGGTIIKAFRVRDESFVPRLTRYPMVWKFLLDTYVPDVPGGSGQRIREDALRSLTDFSNIILAGGIHAGNAPEVVRRYHPFGIDVSSGIEDLPGRKNAEKMAELLGILHGTSG